MAGVVVDAEQAAKDVKAEDAAVDVVVESVDVEACAVVEAEVVAEAEVIAAECVGVCLAPVQLLILENVAAVAVRAPRPSVVVFDLIRITPLEI